MRHATGDALRELEPLLEELRKRGALREKKRGVFGLASRAFLHFHEDASGLFADVRLEDDFVRLPVTTAAQRKSLLRKIDRRLRELAKLR